MARPIAGLAVRLGLAPAVSSRTNMIPGLPAHKRCAERARIVSPLQAWQTNPPACVGSEGHKQQRARVVRTKNRGLYPYTRVRGCASRGHIRAKLVTGFSRSVHKASPAGAGSLLPGRHYACRRKGARSRLAHLPRLPSPCPVASRLRLARSGAIHRLQAARPHSCQAWRCRVGSSLSPGGAPGAGAPARVEHRRSQRGLADWSTRLARTPKALAGLPTADEARVTAGAFTPTRGTAGQDAAPCSPLGKAVPGAAPDGDLFFLPWERCYWPGPGLWREPAQGFPREVSLRPACVLLWGFSPSSVKAVSPPPTFFCPWEAQI
jgi:hypothetical protein